MHLVVLEDRHGKVRSFPLGPGFWVDGAPVRLVPPPNPRTPTAPTRTASGSVAVRGVRARTARASRILVEGRHDAELVEKVWGDDLRVEGVVVEMLDGVDDLAAAVRALEPGPGAGWASSWTTWWPAARSGTRRRPWHGWAPSASTCSSWVTRTSTCGRPSGRSGSGWRRGRRCRAGARGRRACSPRWAGRTPRRPTSRRAGGGS